MLPIFATIIRDGFQAQVAGVWRIERTETGTVSDIERNTHTWYTVAGTVVVQYKQNKLTWTGVM